MTTIGEDEKICAICGNSNVYTSLMSTNTSGYPDLDLRPAEQKRFTMSQWVEECPHCGYAAYAIDSKSSGAEETMSSKEYKGILSGPLNQTLTGRFLKASLIAEAEDNPGSAGYLALCAAWSADDKQDLEGAKEYRNRAVKMVLFYLKETDRSSEEIINARTQLVDIYRRASRWQEAIDLASFLLDDELETTIRSILEFQKEAAKAGDENCYTFAAAIGDK